MRASPLAQTDRRGRTKRTQELLFHSRLALDCCVLQTHGDGPGLETVRTHNADAAAQTLCHHTRMSISTQHFFAAQFTLRERRVVLVWRCIAPQVSYNNCLLSLVAAAPPTTTAHLFLAADLLLLIFYFNGSVLLISAATTTGLGNYFVYICIAEGGGRRGGLLFECFVWQEKDENVYIYTRALSVKQSHANPLLLVPVCFTIWLIFTHLWSFFFDTNLSMI